MFGVPCVGCKVGGVPEILGESNGGLLVEPGNSDELASSIVKLLQNPKQRLTLGREGRRAYERRFSPPVISGQLVDLYLRAMHKHAEQRRGKPQ